ncbi:MAG: FkbM family methyltransferase, partial [Pseudolabrys sp.]
MSVRFFKKLYRNARMLRSSPTATFATLRRNVYQNHLSDVELHSVAIGDHSGQIELFRDPSPESSSLRMSTLRQRHDGPSVAVQLRRLSDFIRSDIDLLKIDVEG